MNNFRWLLQNGRVWVETIRIEHDRLRIELIVRPFYGEVMVASHSMRRHAMMDDVDGLLEYITKSMHQMLCTSYPWLTKPVSLDTPISLHDKIIWDNPVEKS